MHDQLAEAHFDLHILLTTILAIPTQYGGTAVQAVLIFSFPEMTQADNFVKNNKLSAVVCWE